VVVVHVFCVVRVRACVLPLAALFSNRDGGSVVIRGYVPQGAGFFHALQCLRHPVAACAGCLHVVRAA